MYYRSMEFPIGRALRNNIMNLSLDPIVEEALRREGWTLADLAEEEPDSGLGNGGAGRLAACFVALLATGEDSAMVYVLDYEYGIFRHAIRDGFQVEEPDNWLRQPDPWQVSRPGKEIQGRTGGAFARGGGKIRDIPNRPPPTF